MKANTAIVLMVAHFPILFVMGVVDFFEKDFDLWMGIWMISLGSLLLWFNVSVNKAPFFSYKFKNTLGAITCLLIGTYLLFKYFG